MKALQKNLDYTFKNESLLLNALTHSSYANEARGGETSNERLEFLGDSVLSVIVSDYIYKQFGNLPEGELTKLRASLVCEKSLCGFSRELDLGSFLRLGKGEEKGGGRERDSILADAQHAYYSVHGRDIEWHEIQDKSERKQQEEKQETEVDVDSWCETQKKEHQMEIIARLVVGGAITPEVAFEYMNKDNDFHDYDNFLRILDIWTEKEGEENE